MSEHLTTSIDPDEVVAPDAAMEVRTGVSIAFEPVGEIGAQRLANRNGGQP